MASRRERRKKMVARAQPKPPPSIELPPPTPKPEAPVPSQAAQPGPSQTTLSAPPVQLPAPEPSGERPRPSLSRRTACYVDFENFLYSAQSQGHVLDVAKLARQLTRLSREACGSSWAHSAVYASWDQVSGVARHAQDEWAMLGWRTVAVPAREDYLSRRTVKNLVDFVMSLDILEDARDHPYDHFFVASGDADFCEVVTRLKRLDKRVTVVSLRANLSYRLQEMADDYVVCSPADLAGSATMPPMGYRRLAEIPDHLSRDREEDPYQVLCRMVRVAENDQGKGPVLWRVVRDEYFTRTVNLPADEADRFVRDLADAGFVNLVSRKDRSGRSHSYISIPR